MIGRNLTDDMIETFDRLQRRAISQWSTPREFRELQSTLTAIAISGGNENSLDTIADEALNGSRYAYIDGDIVLVEELPEAA